MLFYAFYILQYTIKIVAFFEDYSYSGSEKSISYNSIWFC